MHKLSSLVAGEWTEHSHLPVYEREDHSPEYERLVAGMPAQGSKPFAHLVRLLAPPYFLLYVLHTPRGEAEPGRYQSPAISGDRFETFIGEFGDYLAADARFDIWVHSPQDRATIVWDRHGVLFGYGPIARFAAALETLGFSEGRPSIPSPHVHHYRAEYDAQAKRMIDEFEWVFSELRPEDEQ